MRRLFLVLWTVGAAVGLTGGLEARQGKLRIDKAEFEPAEARPGDTVELRFDATPKFGWHVYGKKETTGLPPSLKNDAAKPEGVLTPEGDLDFPDGKSHESFGMVSYWLEGKISFRQSYRVADDAAPGDVKFRVPLEFMACDPNMCDPPKQITVSADLTILAGSTPAADDAEPAATTGTEIGFNDGRVAVKAVRINPNPARPGQEVTLEIDVEPDFGWHFYGSREEIGIPPHLSIAPPPGVTKVGVLEVPPGTAHDSFGMVSFWVADPTTLKQRLQLADDLPDGSIPLEATFTYMACDESMCDPELDVTLKTTLEVSSSSVVAGATTTDSTSDDAVMGETATSGGKSEDGLLGFLLLAIGAGLLALAMPCTYPMIPITISFFTKQAENRGGSVLPLSLAYGAGIVLIFVVIGVAAGPIIVPFATHPVTNLVIGIAFVVFALALFGLIHLNPPAFLMRGAAGASQHGGYVGVFLMGVTLVITSFTCTMPFVGSLLALGASTGNMTRVALGMATFGLTMAIPFVILSLLPSRLKSIPKSGDWMGVLKVTLGFIELAAALKFFSNAEYVWGWNILPRELFLVICAAIFACAALYLLGFVKLQGDSGEIGPGRLVAGIVATIVTFYFGFGAIGYRLDNQIMLAFEPPYSAVRLGAMASGDGSHTSGDDRHVIIEDRFDEAVALAKEKQMAVLVNFTGKT